MESYIEKTIKSVINQTYTNWELLIIDDCSTDSTCDIVNKFAKEDSRIKLYRNKKNLGVAATRNIGFELALGSYIALLDSDDIWLEDKLSKQIGIMVLNNIDISYCSYRIIDENGKKKCKDFLVPISTDYDEALYRLVLSCSTVVMSRKVIENHRFNTNVGLEDFLFWLQLLKENYTMFGIVEILAEYRIRRGARSSNKLKVILKRFEIYYNYLNLSLFSSCKILVKSIIVGLKKYR